MTDIAKVVEDTVLEAAAIVITPEHVAMVEALAEGFISKAIVDAINSNVQVPFVASLITKLVTDDRVHALLKAAEAKVVEVARTMVGKTATDFDDKLVEIVAHAEGV